MKPLPRIQKKDSPTPEASASGAGLFSVQAGDDPSPVPSFRAVQSRGSTGAELAHEVNDHKDQNQDQQKIYQAPASANEAEQPEDEQDHDQ